MKINPETLARGSSRHPWRTVGIWAAILIAGFTASATLLSPALTTNFDFTNNPEAKQAQQILEQRASRAGRHPGDVRDDRPSGAVRTRRSPTGQRRAARPSGSRTRTRSRQCLRSSAPRRPSAADPQVAALGPIASEDGKPCCSPRSSPATRIKRTRTWRELNAIRERYSTGGTQMYVLGEPTSTDDFKKISEEDLRKGDGIGILVAIVVLIIVFGSLLAGVTPIIMGIFAICMALGLVGLIGKFWHFSFFVPNLISMMGLAVGIDYSLFIVSRYREERARGRDKLEAIGHVGGDREPGRLLQRADRRARPRRHAVGADHDLPRARRRRDPGSADVDRAVDDVAARRSCRSWATRSTPAASSAGAGRGARAAGWVLGHDHPRVMGRPVVWLVLAATSCSLLSVPYWAQSHPTDNGRGIKTGLSGISTIPDGIQTKTGVRGLSRSSRKPGSSRRRTS